MKRLYFSYMALIVGLVGSMATVSADHIVQNKVQISPWYSNNFGASAEDHFGVINPEKLSTGLSGDTRANAIGLRLDDVDFVFGGRVRQEGQLFDRPLTLRDDYADVYGFVRSKLNLDFTSQYGRRTYGRPAAQMHMRLTAFSIWDDAYLYTPILSEKVHFHGANFLKKAEIDSHTHRGVVPLMFLEEGWININFDAFLSGVEFPLSLKVGAFPFIVGRGISLGDYFEGGVEAFGFERRGDIGNAPHKPTGLLLTVGVGDHGIFEFYYSKWRKRSHGPDWTREEVKAKRLDRDETPDPRNIERGQNHDSDICAARFGWTTFLNDANDSIYFEPYAVFLNAPELKVEFDADAALKQGTIGLMTEYHSGQWSVNFECAAQYGKQRMHPIDRNHLIVDDAYYIQTAANFTGETPESAVVAGRLDKQIGQPVKYHSHIFLGFDNPNPDAGEEYLSYRAYYVSDEMKHVNANRTVKEQGGKIYTGLPGSTDTYDAGEAYISQKQKPDESDGGYPNGSLYSPYQFRTGVKYYDDLFEVGVDARPNGSLYNANLPFGAQRRFRDGYTVTNAGVMAMLDVRYTMPDKRMNLSWALGYVGGDEYPFNTEQDKRTSHFMPLRDSNYVGRYVTSFVALYPRKLPRPMEMSDNDLFAHNNYKTMQNIQYVGVGSQWYPLESGTVMLEANALYFWEVIPPHTWNAKTERKFANNTHPDKEDSIYRYIQKEQLHFSGAAIDTFASKNLGLELNVVLSWRPYKTLQFDLRAGIFLPGALYEDTKGCPNINTRRVDEKGDWHFDSLGSQMVSGGQARVTYRF